MILITKIEYVTTPQTRAEVLHASMDHLVSARYQEPMKVGDEAVNVETVREVVLGRVFRKRSGEEVCMAKTQEVGEVLGLEYAYTEGLQDQLRTLRINHDVLRDRLNNIKQSGFFKRLLHLFKGY